MTKPEAVELLHQLTCGRGPSGVNCVARWTSSVTGAEQYDSYASADEAKTFSSRSNTSSFDVLWSRWRGLSAAGVKLLLEE